MCTVSISFLSNDFPQTGHRLCRVSIKRYMSDTSDQSGIHQRMSCRRHVHRERWSYPSTDRCRSHIERFSDTYPDRNYLQLRRMTVANFDWLRVGWITSPSLPRHQSVSCVRLLRLLFAQSIVLSTTSQSVFGLNQLAYSCDLCVCGL